MDFKSNQNIKNKLENSKKILNNYINTENILKSMNSLGIKYFEDKTEITQSLTSEIIYEQINKNLKSDILMSTRKILNEFNSNEINTLTKEVSKVASDLASNPSIKSSVSGSGSVLDKKFGEVTLKQLIGASRNR
jgi:CHASE3 domain sensor protein